MPHSAARPAADPARANPPPGLPTRRGSGLLPQRLVALSVAFLLLVNFPLLALWDHPVQVMGLPLFPLALFVLWGVFIAALAWLLERQPETP
jgi:hypothetical protein